MTLTARAARTKATTESRPARHFSDEPIVAVLAPLAVIGLLCLAWYISDFFVNPLLISSPQAVARDVVSLLQQGPVRSAIALSLRELYLGMGIGLVAGVVLGIAVGSVPLFASAVRPFLNAANATPLNVLLPLLIVWIGIGANARIMFVVLITIFPVLVNTALGISNLDRRLVEVGGSAGLSKRQALFKVVVPGAAPYIFAGARIGISLAIVGMIIGEMEVSNVGIGWFLVTYGGSYETGNLLALIFLTSFLGVANVGVLRLVQRTWFRWSTFNR